METGEHGMSVTHMKNIGKNDSWETPLDIYQQGVELAGFEPLLDVCATHKTAKCSNYFGPDQTMETLRDGLNVPWKMNFFMNPPYSHVSEWVNMAMEEYHTRKNIKGLILTFAKTDTKWWHEYIEPHRDDFNGNIQVHFIKGRIRFWQNGKVGKHFAPYPSVWIVIK